MNSHTDLQLNVLESLVNGYFRVDTNMNNHLQNGYVISGIGLLNGHILPQNNESSKLNEKNISVDNGDINCEYCCINSYTVSVINNHNLVYYTSKRDQFSTNKYLRENNVLLNGVDIDDMSPESTLNQYFNMEYNNVNHNLQSNGKIFT